jgi:hypothetical protein
MEVLRLDYIISFALVFHFDLRHYDRKFVGDIPKCDLTGPLVALEIYIVKSAEFPCQSSKGFYISVIGGCCK